MRKDFSHRPNRRHLLRQTGLMALTLLSGCTTATVIAPLPDGGDQTQAMLAAVNALRTDKGLAPLAPDPAATVAAFAQAQRMARTATMAHLIGLGDSFAARMKSQSVALPAAENIAAGQNDASAAYAAWASSPKHRANMLGPAYRGLGVAVAKNAASGNELYWAMVLTAG